MLPRYPEELAWWEVYCNYLGGCVTGAVAM